MNIKDIARLAGVSVSTVSKVMNRKDGTISQETREKVLKILESKNIQSDIEKLKLKLQKIFLQCVENKIEKARK